MGEAALHVFAWIGIWYAVGWAWKFANAMLTARKEE